MEDMFSDNPTPEGWSESEPDDEESSSSNESEEDQTDFFPFVKKLRMVSPYPIENIEDPTEIMDNPAIIEENPAQILENPALILENPGLILENPALILENPALILENPALILENPAQIMDNPAIFMIENPAQILENPAQVIEIVQDSVELPEQTATVTQKRKMPEADQDTLAHYMLCQRFRLPSWSSVKYAGVKDQFQVSPGFCALKPNDLLPEITHESKYNDLLKRFDLTCGAMVNGLLQNRMIFHETVKDLPRSMQNKVYEIFHGQESQYRKNSDGLLQYTCGRRQEIMQDRRKLYKPPNQIHKKALYKIPPSETHLFEDDAFANLVAQMKGIDKIFPTEKKRRIAYRKHRINQNKVHANRRKIWQTTNRETRHPE